MGGDELARVVDDLEHALVNRMGGKRLGYRLAHPQIARRRDVIVIGGTL